MAYFSESDINEAKRRVRDMQSKADYYVSENKAQGSEKEFEKSRNKENAEKEKAKENTRQNTDRGALSFLGDIISGDDSSRLIILVLIMVLAREEADNKLIFALLYLLL